MTRLVFIKDSLRQISAQLEDTIRDAFLSTVPHLQERLEELRRCFTVLQTKLFAAIKHSSVSQRKTGDKKEVEKIVMDGKIHFLKMKCSLNGSWKDEKKFLC